MCIALLTTLGFILSFKPDGQVNQDVGMRALERCIADIRSWMIDYRLLLKYDKTKVLLINIYCNMVSAIKID